MCKNLLYWLLIINLALLNYCFTIEPVKLELLDDKFRVSIPSDPDIKWVAFNVNINKEFRSFESGQLSGVANMPRDQRWSYEFERNLQDSDVIYIWLAVQHNRLVFRDIKDPISIEAIKSGNPNFVTKATSTTTITESPIEKPSLTSNTNNMVGQKTCNPTITQQLQSTGTICKDDLIFEDNFNTFNEQYWTNEVRIPSKDDEADFVLYNGTLGVGNGILKIDASLTDRNIREKIDLGERCTSYNIETECELTPRGNLFVPPIVSGRINTKKYLNFKYGRVEVRAKLPKGDWLFPIIALKPSIKVYGELYKSGEMRVAYVRGNHDLKWRNENIDGKRLFGGVILTKEVDLRHLFMSDTMLSQVNSRDEHFGDSFHIYSLTWTPDQLILAVDGQEYGRIKANFKKSLTAAVWNKGEQNAPLDQMFYITLGLSAGGHGDFPEDVLNKPWTNTDPRAISSFYDKRGTWIPTWSQPSLEVDYVRVYAI